MASTTDKSGGGDDKPPSRRKRPGSSVSGSTRSKRGASARARLDAAAADRGPDAGVQEKEATDDGAVVAGDGVTAGNEPAGSDDAAHGDGSAAGSATATKPDGAPALDQPIPQAAAAAAASAAASVKPPLRMRILPRSLLGIASLILAFAIGAGFSGVVLFSYYQYKLNQTNDRVNALITGYKNQFAKAEGNLSSDVASAKAEIQNQLKAVQQLQASPAVLANLVKQLAPSVFFVHTLDASGQPSVGTAFVVASNPSQSLLVTSYTTVAAATHSPGPQVFVRQGSADTAVSVRTWDTQYDLALLVLPQGNLHPVTAAPTSPASQPGDRLYAVSGLGTAGASIAQGTVVDVSASGLAVDASIGNAFQGGPLINQSGQVVAVSSRTYSPLGFTTSGIWYSPYVEAACNKVLSCPGGTLPGGH